ncbi:MAG: transcription antitermination factor NusB [Thermodesulfobacteriota bacterium]
MKKPTLPPARRLALDALADCLDRGEDAQAALDAALARLRPDPRDAALATGLVYGYLRLKLRLDHLLSTLLRDPAKLPRPMLRILGLAAFELLHLDKVPDYAVLDWAVEAVKAKSGQSLARVANGVLRAVQRLGRDAASPDFYAQDKPAEPVFLSRFYAAPAWIVDLWLTSYGPEAARSLLAASIAPPPLGLRLHLDRPGAQEHFNRLAAAPDCLAVLAPGLALAPGADPGFDPDAASFAARQSLAGQEAMHRLGAAAWPRPVWDACCGRGGKAALLQALGPGPVFASDPNLPRLRGLRQDFGRLGLPALAFCARADAPPPLARPVPLALLDAPCSGLGVLARRPDIKHKRDPMGLRGLVSLQSRILDHALAAVPPGGQLAYLTCTLNPQENEEQVDALLARAPVRLEQAWSTPPDSPLREFFYGALLTRTG